MGFLGVVLGLTPTIVVCILMFIVCIRSSKFNNPAFDLIPILVLGFQFGIVGAFFIFPALDDPNQPLFFFLGFFFVLHALSLVYLQIKHNRKERDAKKHNVAHKDNDKLKQQKASSHGDADHQHKLATLREMVAEYEEKHQMLKQERDKKD
ncbi:hypothetical protein ACHQM5_023081 [Ranunculus cassubicifolius]